MHLFFYFNWRIKRFKIILDLLRRRDMQPIYNQEVPYSKLPGFTPIYRQKGIKEFKENPDPSVKNMKDLLNYIRTNHSEKNGLGYVVVNTEKNQNGEDVENRTIQRHTYREVLDASYNLGRALFARQLFFQEKLFNMKLIGIYSKNRFEWFVADWACVQFGITSVPLYDTLGVQNLTYCLNQTQMTTLFAERSSIKVLLTLKDIGNLKTVISFDPLDEETIKQLRMRRLEFISYSTLIQQGKTLVNMNNTNIVISKNDCYTFSYTSGTTGPPKGAMISHKNMLACTSSLIFHQDSGYGSEDRHISYLPLPHLLERAISLVIFFAGGQVIISSGNTLKLREDCQVIKPTALLSVPRIYNRFYEAIKGKFDKQTGCKKCLIDMAVNSKLTTAKQSGEFTHCIYDSLVFSKVNEVFGGSIRLALTGSAPISPDVQSFLKIALASPVLDGYGQTQSSGLALSNRALDTTYGSLTYISCGLEVKLADIPEMRYTSQDIDENGKLSPRGEIWVRGVQVFMGYYKLPDITRETITEDGWLKTGDVAQMNLQNLSFKLIDRKKNIFKLQQGEYLAPDKIENVYMKSGLMSEIFLHGDSNKNFAVAIIVPIKDQLQLLAQRKGIKGKYEQLCQNPEIKKLFLTQINQVAKKGGLNGFELAKNIYLEPSPFVNKKIMTNTLKLIRFEARKAYQPEIKRMYDEGEISLK